MVSFDKDNTLLDCLNQLPMERSVFLTWIVCYLAGSILNNI